MLEKDILIGGEESGGIGIKRHLPERDGLLNALLIANVMADEGKTLGQLVESLQQEYGEHHYGRIDLHIPDELKNSAIARANSGSERDRRDEGDRVETLDGMKFFLDNPEASEHQTPRSHGCCFGRRVRSRCCGFIRSLVPKNLCVTFLRQPANSRWQEVGPLNEVAHSRSSLRHGWSAGQFSRISGAQLDEVGVDARRGSRPCRPHCSRLSRD